MTFKIPTLLLILPAPSVGVLPSKTLQESLESTPLNDHLLIPISLTNRIGINRHLGEEAYQELGDLGWIPQRRPEIHVEVLEIVFPRPQVLACLSNIVIDQVCIEIDL